MKANELEKYLPEDLNAPSVAELWKQLSFLNALPVTGSAKSWARLIEGGFEFFPRKDGLAYFRKRK